LAGFSIIRALYYRHWNEEVGLALKSCPDAKAINGYITRTKVGLELHYNQLSALNVQVTAEMVKDAYMPKSVIMQTLMQAFDLHKVSSLEKLSKGKGQQVL